MNYSNNAQLKRKGLRFLFLWERSGSHNSVVRGDQDDSDYSFADLFALTPSAAIRPSCEAGSSQWLNSSQGMLGRLRTLKYVLECIQMTRV